jgi:hypothetical protein
MNEKIRKYFSLSNQGNICEKCETKYIKKYKIDGYLRKNAMLQANLGIDSTQEEVQNAKLMAIRIKQSIAKYDKEFAEEAFPEKDM